ncbi:KEOPS complex subunit Pcc1 [Natribaculum luteum]|uniref:KEOPS complex subunit Pcc1 n=1 Tax=Natribaculum luteum TaxID=1586232 RepID=A0ABD5NX49_9EURY|nr:KEOPS complex subunit Pcc1 [Natribaculum luteum]
MRRATIRTEHDDPELVASAIAPDNTAEMATDVDGDVVVTRIERETTGGLHSTVDDYVVNLDVATTVAQHARTQTDADEASSDTHEPDQ